MKATEKKTSVFYKGALATAVAASAIMSPTAFAQESFTLEEIVVTAQKRAQSLNDVGIAVSAFSGEQMKELGIASAGDMAKHTPGLYLTEAGASGVPVYTVRGVGFDDISPNSNSTVGLYVDEVAVAYPVMSRGMQFDVERIEVLKGPQGDLYGRNNTGGAINFISNKPSEEFEAGITADLGRYDYKKLTGFVSGALSDTVRGRLAVDYTDQSEGDQVNEIDGSRLGEIDTLYARAMLEWDASEDVTVLLNLHAGRDKSDNKVLQAFRGQPSSPDAFGGWGFAAGGAPVLVSDLNDNNAAAWNTGESYGRDNDTWGASVTVNWETEIGTVTSITSYDQFERDETADWDSVPDNRSQLTLMETEIDGWSQELRLSSDGDGDVSWIAGVYFASDTVEDANAFDFRDASNSFGATESLTVYEQQTDIRAVFGHAEWQMSEMFRLTAGVRYTHEERDIDICTYDVDGSLASLYSTGLAYYNSLFTALDELDPATSSPSPYIGLLTADGTPFAQGDCVTAGSSLGTVTDTSDLFGFGAYYGTSGDTTWSLVDNSEFSPNLTTEKLTGKIGVDFMPNNDWLIYASVGTGFKSGGFNGQTSSGRTTYEPYDEEELLAYELGFKATLLDSTMQLNGAAFYYDYRDKQVGDATPDNVFGFLTKLKNVPKSTVEGMELELQWRPVMGLDVKLAATYLDTEVTDFDNGFNFTTFTETEDFSGKELTNAAQWSYNALVSYEMPVAEGFMLRSTVDYMYTDQYYSYLANGDNDLVEGYDVINARLSLSPEDDSWQVSLWGKNLGDEYYYTSTSAGNDVWGRYTGQGKTYGLSFTYNFQ